MKKQLQLLLVLSLWIGSAFSQTPQFAKCCGTASSQYPFKNNGGAKTQLWYNPSDFTVLPQSGNITKVYFRSQVAGQSGTYTNFKILLKQPALGVTQFATSTSFEVGGFTQVLSRPSITINGATSVGGWYEIVLDNAFYYDNTRALVIETQYDAPFAGVGIDNYGTSTTNFKKIYAATLTATTGTASNGFWQDFGIDVSPAAPNNAAISALVGPKAFCAGTQDVIVRLKNSGSNVIYNVDIKWTLDGVPQPAVPWTSPLDTFGGTTYRSDTAVTLGSALFGTTPRIIKVWTEFPNSVADTVNKDDTLNATVQAALSGTYTIGGTSPNYATLAAAATALNSYGVCGPVVFNVAPGSGPYTNLSLGAVGGSSATNTITFNGNGTTISSSTSPLVAFNGSSYVILDSFNISGSGSYVGYGIHLSNQANNITINRNKINVGTTSTATTNAAIVASSSPTAPTTAGNSAKNITITNNEITGGYYGIVMVGTGTYLDNSGHTITNNKIRDFYLYGVYLANADTITVLNNDINRATRATVTTLGGIYLNSSRNAKILNNKIHDCGTTSYTAYPIQIVGCVNATGYETLIANNLIYNIGTTAIFHGITFLTTASAGFEIYHNTIQHNVPGVSTAVARGINFGVAVTNTNFKNNIISISGAGTGIKTGIYVTTTSPTIVSNNNVIHVNTSASNNVGYWTAAQATLLNWQTASTQDASSVSSSPVFTNISAGNLIPLSSTIDNIGATIASVTTDITGITRSTPPDPGAYEFTGIAGDIAITGATVKRSGSCYSMNDTAWISVNNLIGATIDFSLNPLFVTWTSTGPVNSTGTIVISTGTLLPDATQQVWSNSVDMSLPGNYSLRAYISSNSVNLIATNDTLNTPVLTEIKPILSASPKTITVTGPMDTVVLNANSPLFPGGGAFFTEVAHYKVATGAPTSGWPAYLVADDYVEITGVPGTDLAGYTIEEWTTSTTAPLVTSTFPSGTLFSPMGTMIVATGQLTSSVASPSNFYYHTSYAATITSHSSTGDNRGYILKNPSGTIIDATVYGTYTFPAASGVTTADWSGTTPAVSSSGNTMNTPDNNTGSCWVNSGTVPQTPNVLNAGISAPAPGTLVGFDWIYLGSSFSTSPRVTVGPYSIPGVYKYVASFSNACGTFYDTVTVTASATVPVKLTSFTATKENANVNLNWNTASEVNNSHFEIERSENGRDFKTIGRVKGNGTTSRPNRYAFVDANATRTGASTLYYRLKQVDNDGTSTYSRTAVVTLSDKRISGLSTYPNPSNGVFTISAELESTSAATIKVVNVMGKTVWNQVVVNPVLGANVFDAHMQLPKGVYILLFEQDGATSTQKFVIEQ